MWWSGALILTEKEVILPERSPRSVKSHAHNRRIDDLLGTYSLKQAKIIMEKRLIGRAMEAAEGNKSNGGQATRARLSGFAGKVEGI